MSLWRWRWILFNRRAFSSKVRRNTKTIYVRLLAVQSEEFETLSLCTKAYYIKTTTHAYLALLISSWNRQENWLCERFQACGNRFGAKPSVYRYFGPHLLSCHFLHCIDSERLQFFRRIFCAEKFCGQLKGLKSSLYRTPISHCDTLLPARKGPHFANFEIIWKYLLRIRVGISEFPKFRLAVWLSGRNEKNPQKKWGKFWTENNKTSENVENREIAAGRALWVSRLLWRWSTFVRLKDRIACIALQVFLPDLEVPPPASPRCDTIWSFEGGSAKWQTPFVPKPFWELCPVWDNYRQLEIRPKCPNENLF